jgi:SAM-dependent methyltransferase
MDDSPTHFSDQGTVEARRTSFGAGAATYDAVRPPWPADTVDWMLGHPDEPVRVLDLGAGTGLGTRTIATLGHAVVAVDPSAEMLAALSVASERLDPEVAERIETRVGSAEALTDADGTYDAVTAFQSWHWFDAGRTVRECTRVLRSGGWLSMAWHGWSADVAWLRELGDVVGTPEMIWDAEAHAATEPDRIDGFEPAENTQFSVEQRLTPDDLTRLASSWSPVAVRDDREQVLSAVRQLGTRAAGPDGTALFPYVTDCYRYRRR